LVVGDVVPIGFLGGEVSFKVTYTFPKGVVVVTPDTEVVIAGSLSELVAFKFIVAELLENKGYRVVSIGRGENEPDIVAERNGRKVVVKIVSGDKGSFYETLGKLVTLMKDPNAEYMLAATEEYETLLNKIPENVREKLNLKTLIIEKKYSIKETCRNKLES